MQAGNSLSLGGISAAFLFDEFVTSSNTFRPSHMGTWLTLPTSVDTLPFFAKTCQVRRFHNRRLAVGEEPEVSELETGSALGSLLPLALLLPDRRQEAEGLFLRLREAVLPPLAAPAPFSSEWLC